MGNLILQIERLMPGAVPDNGKVIFNSVAYASGRIGYDGQGIITLSEPGVYGFSWKILAQASPSSAGPAFTLFSSSGNAIKGKPLDMWGESAGSGEIKVHTAPVTVWLANSSGKEIIYSDDAAVKADLSLTENAASIEKEAVQPQKPAGGPQISSKPAYPQRPRKLQDTVRPQKPLDNAQGSYSAAQLSFVLSQLIAMYPSGAWTVYTKHGVRAVGKPYQLDPPKDADSGLLLLGGPEKNDVLSLSSIAFVYVGDHTVYNPKIVYMQPPALQSPGLDASQILSIQNYLPLNTRVSVLLDSDTSAGGLVYKNEFGLLVLSDAGGNTPVFIPDNQIESISVVPQDKPQALTDKKQWKKLRRSIAKTKVKIKSTKK